MYVACSVHGASWRASGWALSGDRRDNGVWQKSTQKCNKKKRIKTGKSIAVDARIIHFVYTHNTYYYKGITRYSSSRRCTDATATHSIDDTTLNKFQLEVLGRWFAHEKCLSFVASSDFGVFHFLFGVFPCSSFSIRSLCENAFVSVTQIVAFHSMDRLHIIF